MPQPLSRVNPKARIQFAGAELERYPELTCLVMETISAISYAEHGKGRTLSVLLGAEPDIGLAMFTSLTSTVAQDAALAAAATLRLDNDDKAIFDEIKRITKPIFKRRNDFAHHMWGVSNDIPNALLLMDSKEYLSFHGDDVPFVGNVDNVYVYKRNDLMVSVKSAWEAGTFYTTFATYLIFKLSPVKGAQGRSTKKARAERAAKLAELRAELPTPSTPQPRSR